MPDCRPATGQNISCIPICGIRPQHRARPVTRADRAVGKAKGACDIGASLFPVVTEIFMKSGLILASLAIFSPLWLPYGSFVTKSAGNPDWQPYIGQPGSTYDSAANPAQTIGTVAYDPNAPLPSTAPASQSGSATMAAPAR
jgi:hypothetical protein